MKDTDAIDLKRKTLKRLDLVNRPYSTRSLRALAILLVGVVAASGCRKEPDEKSSAPPPQIEPPGVETPQEIPPPVPEPEHGQTRPPIPPPAVVSALPPDGGEKYNRLIFEKSPYLLQHAANPVDWFPWGDEAFEKARRENKPIFLSIGYSTCHWCHVMEHESFEDDEVAALMNKYFVCIKVDREERPDVDHVYMTVTQTITGRGGWPMTVFMTPDKRPFHAGTYYPKRIMMELLPGLERAWRERRGEIETMSRKIVAQLRQISSGQAGPQLTEAVLERAFKAFAGAFQPTTGGFAVQPKFPMPHNSLFLLSYWQRSGQASALEMVEKTLREMRLGGIFDHVGFGFHRYSTDKNWLVPHFEKMLYDQALLIMAYTAAFQATGNDTYQQTAREIMRYITRDMTSPEGGFYSAEDADSEGEEGKFYLWTPAEIAGVVGSVDAEFYCSLYNITTSGNFHDESSRQKTGRSIPHLKKPLAELAVDMDLEPQDVIARVEKIRRKLFDVREARIHPLKDDKILTDWNGLMISAMARAGQAFGDPSYVDAARKAADFVISALRDGNGRLLKRYRLGEAGLPALLEDYAFFVMGLIDLYEATFDARYLEMATQLTDDMLKHFWDPQAGALFLTADDGEQLLVRAKEVYDGAIPSGNSVAAYNLLRLSRATGNMEYDHHARKTMTAFSAMLNRSPSNFSMMMLAADFAVGPSMEIVISGTRGTPGTDAMLNAVRTRYLPRKIIVYRPDEPEQPDIAKLAPYTSPMLSLQGKATAYVCRNFACQLPTTDIAKLIESITDE